MKLNNTTKKRTPVKKILTPHQQVEALLSNWPKRYKEDKALETKLQKVLNALGYEEQVFPIKWEDTGYLYDGLQVGEIKFCEKSIFIKFISYNGEIDTKYIEPELLYDGHKLTEEDVVFHWGLNKAAGKHSLFKSKEAYDKYRVDVLVMGERGKTAAKPDVPVANAKHYAVLGLDHGCSQEEIKEAYRSMSSFHHPDRGGNTERMKMINTAYDALTSL